jgi:peptidoglycan hydrolase CwlO-like protein
MDTKTDVPGIYKSSEGVLINKDNEALKAYKKRKEKERKIEELEQNVSAMKNDLEEIKNLLRGLSK